MLAFKHFRLLSLLFASLFFFGFNPMDHPKTVTFSTTETIWAIIDCANGGLGETVQGDVTIHWTQHYNSQGDITKTVAHPQGGTIYGETTGMAYQVTGASAFLMDNNPDKGAFTDTVVNRFHIVGGGTQFTAFFTIHVTINAGGEIAANFERIEFDCK